jgi:hypothetical protein
MREIGLRDRLRTKLESIPHTSFPYDFMPYLPASASLKGSRTEECVVFFGESAYRRIWGPDETRRFVDIDEVLDVKQSTHQLLPEFASKLYEGGENFMGGTRFVLTMKDGNKFYYSLGGILDFVDYPLGYGMYDVAEVKAGIPLELRSRLADKILGHPQYAWCLYKEPDKILAKVKSESPRL